MSSRPVHDMINGTATIDCLQLYQSILHCAASVTCAAWPCTALRLSDTHGKGVAGVYYYLDLRRFHPCWLQVYKPCYDRVLSAPAPSLLPETTSRFSAAAVAQRSSNSSSSWLQADNIVLAVAGAVIVGGLGGEAVAQRPAAAARQHLCGTAFVSSSQAVKSQDVITSLPDGPPEHVGVLAHEGLRTDALRQQK